MSEWSLGPVALKLLVFHCQRPEVDIRPENLRLNLGDISEQSGISADDLRELGDEVMSRLAPQTSSR